MVDEEEKKKRNKQLQQERIVGTAGNREPERTTPLTGEQAKSQARKDLLASGAKGLAAFDPRHPTTTGRASDKLTNIEIDGVRLTEKEKLERKETAKMLAAGGRISITPEQVQEQQDIAQQDKTNIIPQNTQPEQTDLRLDQNIARVGLAIPTFAANQITGILESVTGKTFGRTTTTELSQTTAGEALGLGIVGTGLALGGMLAYESYLSGLSAQQLINIAGTKALPTSFRLPAVSTLSKMTAKKFIFGAAGVTTISRTIRKDAKQAIIGNKEMIDGILEDVALRGKSFAQAKQELNDVETNINQLASKIKFAGLFDLTYWLSGGHDDLTDVTNVRNYLEDARSDLIGVAQQAVLTR